MIVNLSLMIYFQKKFEKKTSAFGMNEKYCKKYYSKKIIY